MYTCCLFFFLLFVITVNLYNVYGGKETLKKKELQKAKKKMQKEKKKKVKEREKEEAKKEGKGKERRITRNR